VSLFFHAHTDACDPVCILKQSGEQYVFTVDPRPLLYDDEASVERLAAALTRLAFAPDGGYGYIGKAGHNLAAAIIAALRDGGES
jgi:hypothetical protein